MKYIVIFSILIFCLSCSQEKSEEIFVPASFQLDSTSVVLNFTPMDIIQFNDGYLCRIDSYHQDSMSLIHLNDKFELQYTFSRNLNKTLNRSVNAIWTSNDTLFAIQGYKNYTISFWNNNLWQVLDFGGMTKENFMSQELNYPIFEDEHYIVRSCCKGEFGGALFFKHKKSQRTFSCRATCIAGVHKIDSSYFITSSLAHGNGFSQVSEVNDPKKMFEIKDQKQLFDCSWYDIYPEDPRDEISQPVGYSRNQGRKILLDTMGLFILGSFDYKNQLYHIYSDMDNSYIGYINNGKLSPIDTIYSKPMWLSEVRDLKHNPNIFPIRSRGMKGIILRQDKKLKIIEFINS